jgi:soluble lytic murein transglycosylase-like protein
MKRTRPPATKLKRAGTTSATSDTASAIEMPPAASTSPPAKPILPADPVSISGMLRVASDEPAIRLHYPVLVTTTTEPVTPWTVDWSAGIGRLQALFDEGQSLLATVFTRRVQRRQAVRRTALPGATPRQARRMTEPALFRNLQGVLDRFVNARTPWRYIPWAMSVALAGYFIWRGPAAEPYPSPGLSKTEFATSNAATAVEVADATDVANPTLDAVLADDDDAQRAGSVAQELSKEAADLAQPVANEPFGVPLGLRPAVAFWQRVFGIWGAGEVVLHDSEHLGIVYRVVQLPVGAGGARLTPVDQRAVDQQKQHLCATLNDLEYRLKRRQGLTQEQTRLLRQLTLMGGRGAVSGAAERVRIQRGMRNSFRQGLAVSGRYERAFRQVFRENGLPEDLVYLAHVESAFTSRARSPAGAVGVWQFMPETGRRFLRIDRSLDERYDPVFSTRGAARYFTLAHDKLDDWGLTVTSFNHGLTGMLNAKAECGANIECVVHRYAAPSFGFASRNYYAEFLAIRSIVKNLPRYFPDGVNFAAPLDHKRIRLARAVPVQEVARAHGLGLQDLIGINPAWTSAAAEGRVALPVDTEIWIPEDAKDASISGLVARIETDTTAALSH